jgi:flagellar biosynthesis/type III secretory pathway M-ring protein FliF/YscJ
MCAASALNARGLVLKTARRKGKMRRKRQKGMCVCVWCVCVVFVCVCVYVCVCERERERERKRERERDRERESEGPGTEDGEEEGEDEVARRKGTMRWETQKRHAHVHTCNDKKLWCAPQKALCHACACTRAPRQHARAL